MNFFKYAQLLSPLPFLSGCDRMPDFLTELLHNGTLKGTEACMRRDTRTDVDEIAKRTACVRKHEIQLPPQSGIMEGWQGDVFSPAGDQNWIMKMKMHNASSWTVVTRVQLSAYIYDSTEAVTKTSATFDKLWLKPGDQTSVQFPFMFNGTLTQTLTTCSDRLAREKSYKNCMV